MLGKQFKVRSEPFFSSFFGPMDSIDPIILFTALGEILFLIFSRARAVGG